MPTSSFWLPRAARLIPPWRGQRERHADLVGMLGPVMHELGQRCIADVVTSLDVKRSDGSRTSGRRR